MRRSTRSTKKAAKAKLSGFVSSNDNIQNRKIVFGDNDDVSDVKEEPDENQDDVADVNTDAASDVKNVEDEDQEDESVEEVKGNIARESTRQVRNAERDVVKSTIKKKRKKKSVDTSNQKNQDEIIDIDKDDSGELTSDFFDQLDSERADLKLNQKKKKKNKGKHITFTVEEDEPTEKKVGDIQVISLSNNDNADLEEENILLSARLGCTSSNSTLFARGKLNGGGDMERGSGGRRNKSGSKKEEGWKRGKVKVYRSGVGAALLFGRR
ncbi:hypothetical protein ACHAXN_010635 [Cyclotella atomus]|jgi:hypothetical protein